MSHYHTAEQKDRYAATARRRYWANREAALARKDKYRAENPKVVAATMRRHQTTHPEFWNERSRRRDALKKAQVCECCTSKQVEVIYKKCREISAATGVPHEVDHIIAITNGGLHCLTNLQILTRVENQQKGAK